MQSYVLGGLPRCITCLARPSVRPLVCPSLHWLTVLCPSVCQRNPLSPDFGPIFKRRWREASTQLDGLKHLPRGHNPSIHVKYPNFKEAVQSITHDLNGRTDKGRNSATVYLGNSTWSMIADRLADAAYMSTLGGTIPVSVSALKQHKARSARSRQQKCSDPSGQLDVSHRKVAKLLMPTAVEQPNGHMMNLTIKELERFGMLNSSYIDLVNRYLRPVPPGAARRTRPASVRDPHPYASGTALGTALGYTMACACGVTHLHRLLCVCSQR